MSIQRERTYSSRSKQVLIKVSHLSKRLPEDFFLQKALSSSPKKRESQVQQKQIQNWYERDDSGDKDTKKLPSRFIRNKNQVKICKVGQQMQPQTISNENQSFFNKLLENSKARQNLILKGVRQPKKQSIIKVIPRLPSNCQRQRRHSSQRIIRSQSKRYRRYKSPCHEPSFIVREARMSLKELQKSPFPSRYQNMNVGFDGLLTFNRFA